MPDVAFVISPRQPYPLGELAETVRYELELQGIPSTLSSNGFPAPRPDLVYVLLDPKAYVEFEGVEALPEEAVLRRTVVLGSERPGVSTDPERLTLLKRAGVVFDLDPRVVGELRRQGVVARLLRPGYSRLRDHYDPTAARPIDVMFLGAHSLRRTEHLRRCARVLARRNCLLQFSGVHAGPTEGPAFLGESRWPLLAQTKVVINIHRDEEQQFEWLRAVDAIHAGAVVVSEQASGITALEPGKHLLVADGDALPYVVESLLNDEERLRRIRGDAYERLRSWIPFALSASVFRAAIVEVLGRPLHGGVALRGGFVADDDQDESTGNGNAELERRFEQRLTNAQAELSEMRVELLELRSELVQVRRQAASLRRDLLGGTSIRLVAQSPAWAARRRPRVTIVVALHEDALRIADTLDSVAGSWMREFELVVVDSGSHDGSAAIAEHWIAEHPRVPATLVDDRDAQGRGAARNTGLDFARGDAVLILDPGGVIYSHCLQRLADTLAAMDDFAFVYPMIEVSTESDWFVRAGGDNLLNVFGWEPVRLRSGNFIHAPYLVRLGVLRKLGGFTTDPALDRFEDYDLWCRVAEQGWRGQQLAQLLARRAEIPSSSCLSTVRPAPGPGTRALMSRAPRAMAGAFTRQAARFEPDTSGSAQPSGAKSPRSDRSAAL